MATSKKNASASFPPRWLRHGIALAWGPGRTPALLALLVVTAAIGWFLVWRHVRPRLLASGDYLITLENVHITPQPEWIRGRDLRVEVFRDGSLDSRLSLLDDDLAKRIGDAFSLHPWIAKVVQVRKRPPDRVEVELVYRRPVCMVEVPGDLLPIDAQGVLLPSGDFSPLEKQSYPRLLGVEARPVAPVGRRWADARVLGAAEVAAALDQRWRPWRLDRIVAMSGPNGTSTDEPAYALLTRGGTQIYWGLPPSTRALGEITAAEKIGRLNQYVEEYKTLDGRDGPQRLDVRRLPAARGKT